MRAPCRRWFVVVLGAVLASLSSLGRGQEPTDARLDEQMLAWFLAGGGDAAPVPPAFVEPLTRQQVDALLPRAVVALRTAVAAAGERLLPTPATRPSPDAVAELDLGAQRMPFLWLQKGEKPPGGWPLFLCLHGGGGNAEAPGPHGWEVNSREWAAQQRLFERVWQAPGLYFIPRMADDRRGRWWLEHNQRAFDEVIRRAILFADVDPDRVYLMGISEGGYGAIRFAGNRPDRFAAAGGMAAAEPIGTSPPENMRNLAVRIDLGERDTMFDRIGLARTMAARLAELRAADPGGYDFVLHEQVGRGHGIDYALTPAWLAGKVRNARPDRVVWRVVPFDGQVELRHHWLALRARPAALPLAIDARCIGNRLVIEAHVERPGPDGEVEREPVRVGWLRVRLDDELADLSQPLVVVVNGEERGRQTPPRTLLVLLRTLWERWDPRGAFPCELELDLGAR
jgi:predicted esterase